MLSVPAASKPTATAPMPRRFMSELPSSHVEPPPGRLSRSRSTATPVAGNTYARKGRNRDARFPRGVRQSPGQEIDMSVERGIDGVRIEPDGRGDPGASAVPRSMAGSRRSVRASRSPGRDADAWLMLVHVVAPTDWRLDQEQAAMRSLVGSGDEPGLLAYADGVPVGWVSVGRRDSFAQLLRSPQYKPHDNDQQVFAIVCFYVDPRWKQSGVGTALVDAAMSGRNGTEPRPSRRTPMTVPTSWGAAGPSSGRGFTQSGPQESVRSCGWCTTDMPCQLCCWVWLAPPSDTGLRTRSRWPVCGQLNR